MRYEPALLAGRTNGPIHGQCKGGPVHVGTRAREANLVIPSGSQLERLLGRDEDGITDAGAWHCPIASRSI